VAATPVCSDVIRYGKLIGKSHVWTIWCRNSIGTWAGLAATYTPHVPVRVTWYTVSLVRIPGSNTETGACVESPSVQSELKAKK
jgi:hypothetical protein